MLVDYKTQKLYYGFPIFILGYEDELHGMNITTCSSSYSLADTVTLGLVSTTNAARQIKRAGRFTMNIIDENLMELAEFAGIKEGRPNQSGKAGTDKLEESGAAYGIIDGLPVLDQAKIVLFCSVTQIYEDQGVTHFIGQIDRRLLDNSLLNQSGRFVYENFDPVLYEGDTRRRMYRFIENGQENHSGIKPFGSYIRRARPARQARPAQDARQTRQARQTCSRKDENENPEKQGNKENYENQEK